MPFTPEQRKEYDKKRYAANRDVRRKQKREARLANLDHYRKKSEERNRAAGFQARKSKPGAGRVRVSVPVARRYIIIGEEVYFNVQTGFTRQMLREILRELTNSQPAEHSPGR